MEDIYDVIDKANSKNDFINFLNLLAEDSKKHKEEWVNPTISDYLEQVAGWIEDFSECPRNDIDWAKIDYSVIARMLYMGKIYE